jgi:3D (Asp-Asp-Asp) domain-containing protein
MRNLLKRLCGPVLALAISAPSTAEAPVTLYGGAQKIAATYNTASSYAGKVATVFGQYSVLDPAKIVAYTAVEILKAGNPIELFTATAYTLAENECGKSKNHPLYGITTSGKIAKAGVTIAADPKHMGKIFYIPALDPSNPKFRKLEPLLQKYLISLNTNGYFRADDTGGVVKGGKIDIFFGEDKVNMAKIFGKRKLEVYVVDDAKQLAEELNDTLSQSLGFEVDPQLSYLFQREMKHNQ